MLMPIHGVSELGTMPVVSHDPFSNASGAYTLARANVCSIVEDENGNAALWGATLMVEEAYVSDVRFIPILRQLERIAVLLGGVLLRAIRLNLDDEFVPFVVREAKDILEAEANNDAILEYHFGLSPVDEAEEINTESQLANGAVQFDLNYTPSFIPQELSLQINTRRDGLLTITEAAATA